MCRETENDQKDAYASQDEVSLPGTSGLGNSRHQLILSALQQRSLPLHAHQLHASALSLAACCLSALATCCRRLQQACSRWCAVWTTAPVHSACKSRPRCAQQWRWFGMSCSAQVLSQPKVLASAPSSTRWQSTMCCRSGRLSCRRTCRCW